MKFGKVLVLLIASNFLATPVMAGLVNGYGKQVQSRQIANAEVMECPMVNHLEGDRSAGNDKADGHHYIHTQRR